MKVLCVLKTGGEYRPIHVYYLQRMVETHLEGAEFICLTDDPYVPPDIAEPLKHDWPGWWSKLELFRHEGPLIYMDLDTIIVSELEWLAEIAREHRFTMLRDVYRKDKCRGSGIMTWSGDMSHLYEGFCDYQRFPDNMGDQNWIEQQNQEPSALQDLAPGKLASFKADLQRCPPKAETSVVFFHGPPRPWQQEAIPYPSV